MDIFQNISTSTWIVHIIGIIVLGYIVYIALSRPPINNENFTSNQTHCEINVTAI